MEPKSILTGLKKTIITLGYCVVIFLSFNSSVLAQKNLYPSLSSAKEKVSNKKSLTSVKEPAVSTYNTTTNQIAENSTTSDEKHSLYQNENGSLYHSNDNIYMEPEIPSNSGGGGGLYAPPPEGGNPTGGETPVGNPGIGILLAMGAYALYILCRSKKVME